jgi:hypothetical protein
MARKQAVQAQPVGCSALALLLICSGAYLDCRTRRRQRRGLALSRDGDTRPQTLSGDDQVIELELTGR